MLLQTFASFESNLNFCTLGLQSENQEKRFWHRSAFKNSAKCRQTFSHVLHFIFKGWRFCFCYPKFQQCWSIFQNFSNFYREYHNIRDSQISWDNSFRKNYSRICQNVIFEKIENSCMYLVPNRSKFRRLNLLVRDRTTCVHKKKRIKKPN